MGLESTSISLSCIGDIGEIGGEKPGDEGGLKSAEDISWTGDIGRPRECGGGGLTDDNRGDE